MVPDGLEISRHEGEGYKPLVSYGAWRTAILNRGSENDCATISYVERHNKTDEVFILMKGKGALLIGGYGSAPSSIEWVDMALYSVYNVKAGAWHAAILSDDASVVIVENDDTSSENSEYHTLGAEDKKRLQNKWAGV